MLIDVVNLLRVCPSLSQHVRKSVHDFSFRWQHPMRRKVALPSGCNHSQSTGVVCAQYDYQIDLIQRRLGALPEFGVCLMPARIVDVRTQHAHERACRCIGPLLHRRLFAVAGNRVAESCRVAGIDRPRMRRRTMPCLPVSPHHFCRGILVRSVFQ